MRHYHKSKAEHLNMPLYETKPRLYKGYWIKPNNIYGFWWVEKDGHCILRECKTIPEAEAVIDQLTEDK